MNNKITIKKSPAVIVWNFIVIELISFLVFYIAAISADYGEIYANFHIAKIIPFEAVELSCISAYQIIFTVFLFLRWFYENYEIRRDSITHNWGVIFKKKTAVQLGRPISVGYHQGFLSKIINYGRITIQDASSKKPIILEFISNPKKYAELIMNFRSRTDNNFSDALEFKGDVKELFKKGERDKLEFKTTFRWDIRANNVSKDIEKSTMKTIAAFLNSGGGYLAIGVDDVGSPVGLERDYWSLAKKNADGFENHFNNLFNSTIGVEFRRFVKLEFQNVDGKEICLVTVVPSAKPAYLRTDENEDFYIRTGNSTVSLKISEVATYISTWWGK